MSAYDPIQDATEQLVEWLKASSRLTTLLDGPTPAKEPGGDRVESIFPNLDKIPAFDEVTERMVRKYGVLVFSDPVAQFYKWRGDIYVLPPIEEELKEPSSFESDLDRAVREAGFATEELRHVLRVVYECLYQRMIDDPIKGFTEKEWMAVTAAKELLGLGPASRGAE